METEKKLKFNPDDMIAAADEQFLTWMKEGRYAELIDTMPNLGRYSLRNQMLILMQNPKATFVNGMNAWNYKRRHIEKGQTSIPVSYTHLDVYKRQFPTLPRKRRLKFTETARRSNTNSATN